MSTSEEQQSQISELRADFRVLQEKYISHERKTDIQLQTYKIWTLGGGSALMATFLVLAITIIVTLALYIL